MLAHIDFPKSDQPADACYPWVQGWIWAGAGQERIAAIEAWIGPVKIGETSARYIRPDAAALLGLPLGMLLGFTIAPTRLSPVLFEDSHVRIALRWHDGGRVEDAISVPARYTDERYSPLRCLTQDLGPNTVGLEIGAHSNPVPFVRPFYTDAVRAFVDRVGFADFLSDARYLPIATASLDYVCSSHVIEHLPNPLGALFEWLRVLKTGGYLYLVAPDMRFTFDRMRGITPVSHLLADYLHDTQTCSPAHLHDFIFATDWQRLRPGTAGPDTTQSRLAAFEEYATKLKRGDPVDIHYHTFTPESLVALLRVAALVGGRSAAFEVVQFAERYPPDRGDGIALLLQKKAPEAAQPAETYRLTSPTAGQAILPLACPVTLRPLTLLREPSPSGRHVLRESISGRAYFYDGAIPSLRPPAGTTPRRVWNSPLARLARHVAGSTRLPTEPAAWPPAGPVL